MTFSFGAWLGRGPAMCEVVWVGVSRGGTVRVGCIRGPGGWAWVVWGLRGDCVRATGLGGRAAGRGAPLHGCVRVVECGGW